VVGSIVTQATVLFAHTEPSLLLGPHGSSDVLNSMSDGGSMALWPEVLINQLGIRSGPRGQSSVRRSLPRGRPLKARRFLLMLWGRRSGGLEAGSGKSSPDGLRSLCPTKRLGRSQ